MRTEGKAALWVLTGIGFLLYYVMVRLIFLPTKLLMVLGSKGRIHGRIRKPLVISDSLAEQIRDDLAKDLIEGAERILEYHNIESIPVSRHVYRHQGLRAVRDTEAQLGSGEFLVSILLIGIGVFASVTTFDIGLDFLALPREPFISRSFSSILSIGTAVIGLLILIFVSLRNSVVNHLTYNETELSVGSAPEELLMKMVWNEFVSENPAKVLQLFYLLMFSRKIGRAPYSLTKSVLLMGMDPNANKWDVLWESIPEFIESIQEALEDDRATSDSR